jgi:hypothetical protein
MRPVFPLLLLALTAPLLPAQEAWRSALYPENWTPAFTDEAGRFLHDFSYAGYRRGEAELPRIEGPVFDVTKAPFNADPTGAQNATAALQGALDAAKKAGGGVVYLPPGTYRVAPPEGQKVALRLEGDGVLLRGAGKDKSFIFNDDAQMRGKIVLKLAPDDPADWHKEGPGVHSAPLKADVPNRATQVSVETAGFAVGDLVVLRSDLTQRFIDSVAMNGTWKPAGAASANRTLMFCRRVTAIDAAARTLTFDVPVRYPVLMADAGRVVKLPGRPLREAGVEDLALGMKQHPGTELEEQDFGKEGTAGYEVHGARGLEIQYAENCWVRGVATYAPPGNDPAVHVVSNMLAINRSRFVTVRDCDFRHAQYKGGGGNGYLYCLQGQECLITASHAEGGRHNYDFGTMYCSGNVINECYSKDGKLASDFHMFLSMANLLDHLTCEGDFLEARHIRPFGGNPVHGVTTTQSVFWNTVGLRYPKKPQILILSHQEGEGYVIGTQGPASAVQTTDFAEGIGKSAGLQPPSLYQDQLQRRRAR